MTDIELEQLAEEARNEINKVAYCCSGEIEEHIFDVGFITGYRYKDKTKVNGEIIVENRFSPNSIRQITCLEYALTFWNEHRDYKIYYNSDHVINLKEGTIPPEGYLELKEFGLNHLLASFYYNYTFAEIIYVDLLKEYFADWFKEKATITVEEGTFKYDMPLVKKKREIRTGDIRV